MKKLIIKILATTTAFLLRMRRSSTFFGIIFIGLFTWEMLPAQYYHTIKFGVIQRYYQVYLPQNYEPNMPVVLSLHGYSESLDFYREFTEMHTYADTAGFIVVYPVGMNESWNIGIEYCPIRSPFPDVDDVGFISALIDSLYSQYDIDLTRVYCCGFSTGADMTLRLAFQMGERFAAIAAVGGVLNDAVEKWHPVKRMPVMHINGTDDMYSLYYGPGSYPGRLTTAEEWSMDKTLDYWIEQNNCIKPGDTIDIPDLVPEDNCIAQRISFAGDSDYAPVIHYKILNGGHSWPGSPYDPLNSWEGYRNMDFSATSVIWEFFKQYENSLVNLAKSISLEVDPALLIDTFSIRSEISNPESHSINVYAIIQGDQTDYSDTIQLFDDGLHHDEDPLDNIWGNTKLADGLQEDCYIIDLTTHDLTLGKIQYYHQPARLINFGPVALENYNFQNPDDTAFYPGKRQFIYLDLVNNSATATATDITARLVSLDPMVTTGAFLRDFEDIPAGGSSISGLTYYIDIADDCPANTTKDIAIEIYSYDHLCWTDTFSIYVQEPDLIETKKGMGLRIYPNPATDQLSLEFDQTDIAQGSIMLFDITGKLVYSEMIGNTDRQTHTLNLSSLRKGLYFIRISNERYSVTEKVIKTE